MAYDDPMRPELPKRPSRTVDRADAPAIRRREELEALLRTHDPDEAAEASGRITLDDSALLRQMAIEGGLSGADPGVRAAAVSMLARFPTVENLNLLVELARRGEDPGVRARRSSVSARPGSSSPHPCSATRSPRAIRSRRRRAPRAWRRSPAPSDPPACVRTCARSGASPCSARRRPPSSALNVPAACGVRPGRRAPAPTRFLPVAGAREASVGATAAARQKTFSVIPSDQASR